MTEPTEILPRLRVLIVDDMDAIRSMVKTCIRELGVHKIHLAINGEDAAKQLSQNKIDMIICDWDMPKMTGLEFLKLVRSNEDTAHIPFLMLTASVDKPRVISAIENKVSDYLSKPFKPKELEFRVIKLLRKVDMHKLKEK